MEQAMMKSAKPAAAASALGAAPENHELFIQFLL
jgi:hypothetical protein